MVSNTDIGPEEASADPGGADEKLPKSTRERHLAAVGTAHFARPDFGFGELEEEDLYDEVLAGNAQSVLDRVEERLDEARSPDEDRTTLVVGIALTVAAGSLTLMALSVSALALTALAGRLFARR